MQRNIQMFKKFFKSFDMFTAVPSLRVQGESQHASVGAGVLSLLILMGFMFMFINASIQILTYKKISAIQSTKRVDRQGQIVNHLNFAFGIKDLNVSEVQQALSVSAWHVLHKNGQYHYEQIELVPCQVWMWEQLGKQKAEMFQSYSIGSLVCPKYPQKLQLLGSSHCSSYQNIQFYLSVCDSESYKGNLMCLQEDVVDQIISNITLEQKYIEGVFIYLNTGFNPSDKDPLIKFIDDTIWVTFTHLTGTEAFVQIGTYSIETDVSFSPFQQKQVLNGTYLANFMSSGFERGHTGVYLMVQVSLSPTHSHIQRKYGKIDEAISYVGGLFGILISLLGLFFMSFNQYRYELIVGQGVFSLKDGNRVKQKNFHFHTYVKYAIYDWIKVLFCCEPQWKECQQIDETREQAIEQIDVKALLKRIQHLQKAVRITIPYNEDISLYVTEPNNIHEVKKRRKLSEYFEKIVRDRLPLTIKNAQLIRIIAGMGLGQKQQHFNQQQMSDSATNFNYQQHPRTKRKRTSIQIINQSLKQYRNYLDDQENQIDDQLDEDDLVLQKQISQSLYNLPECKRMGIIQSIPLIILKRLKEVHDKIQYSQNQQNLGNQNTIYKQKQGGFLSFIKLAHNPSIAQNIRRNNKVKNQFKVSDL